jgi:hypothetical protein
MEGRRASIQIAAGFIGLLVCHGEVSWTGSDDMEQVVKAACIGRIATLLIESGRQINGVFDSTTGQAKLGDIINQRSDGLLDCRGECVRKMGGSVMTVPLEQMPGRTGLTAIYRY